MWAPFVQRGREARSSYDGGLALLAEKSIRNTRHGWRRTLIQPVLIGTSGLDRLAITTGFRSALSIPINVSVSPGFRSGPWRGVVVPSNLAGAIRAARSGCQLPVQKPDINLINRNVWTDRSSFILQIEHLSLAVDHLPFCIGT